jgi:hypothetical protein
VFEIIVIEKESVERTGDQIVDPPCCQQFDAHDYNHQIGVNVSAWKRKETHLLNKNSSPPLTRTNELASRR